MTLDLSTCQNPPSPRRPRTARFVPSLLAEGEMSEETPRSIRLRMREAAWSGKLEADFPVSPGHLEESVQAGYPSTGGSKTLSEAEVHGFRVQLAL